jgi:hypothetical protein
MFAARMDELEKKLTNDNHNPGGLQNQVARQPDLTTRKMIDQKNERIAELEAEVCPYALSRIDSALTIYRSRIIRRNWIPMTITTRGVCKTRSH